MLTTLCVQYARRQRIIDFSGRDGVLGFSRREVGSWTCNGAKNHIACARMEKWTEDSTGSPYTHHNDRCCPASSGPTFKCRNTMAPFARAESYSHRSQIGSRRLHDMGRLARCKLPVKWVTTMLVVPGTFRTLRQQGEGEIQPTTLSPEVICLRYFRSALRPTGVRRKTVSGRRSTKVFSTST